MKLEQIENRRNKNSLKLTKCEIISLRICIYKYYEVSSFTFNAEDVANFVNSSLNKDYPTYFIRDFMKTHANFSFKQVKSRPSSMDLEKLKYVRILFKVEFLKQVTSDTLIINIDESSINRHIKPNCSWSFKGLISEVINSSYSGFMNM